MRTTHRPESAAAGCRAVFPRSRVIRATVAACAGLVTHAAWSQGQVVGWGDQIMPVGSLLRARAIAAGGYHSVELQSDGTVRAWGLSNAGQCAVPGDLGPCTQVSAGETSTVALRLDGTPRAWGGCPDAPPDVGPCVRVAAGSSYALAIGADGLVHAWGFGAPEPPSDLGPCTRIAAGASHAMAIRVDGAVRAWGDDGFGKCQVPEDLGVGLDIEVGDGHSVAVVAGGQVRAWGNDADGQVTVPSELGACTQVAAGLAHTVALRADGGVRAWGYDAFGQCSVPADLGACAQIAAGSLHTLALRADGEVRAWGNRDQGRCEVPVDLGLFTQVAAGVGLRSDASVQAWRGGGFSPQPPTNLGPCAFVAGGAAIRLDGSVVVWSGMMYGQSMVPADLGACTRVDTSGDHVLAVRVDGGVRAWGKAWYGQCAVPPELGACTEVAAGGDHSLALAAGGSVAAWGLASAGQTAVPSDLGACAGIDAGGTHSIALRSDGVVRAWGQNLEGQCAVPEDLGPCSQVAAGAAHSLALRSDGSVRAWGSSAMGAIDVPPGLSGCTQIAAQGARSVALLSPQASACGGAGGVGDATVARGGGRWQTAAIWSWSDQGLRVPGAASVVDLGDFGSVGSECDADAGAFTSRAGASLLVSPEATIEGNDFSVRVTNTANLAGRVWLLGVSGGGSTLPEDLDLPVLSAGTVNGFFDLIQSEVPPPAGYFLTLVPSDVNGRTLLSLKLLPLPGNAELSGANAGTFAGTAVAAGTLDLNHDGFDDLALAVDFGAGQNGLIQVLLNDGAGNLGGTSVLCQIPPQPTCLAVGDVDGDGLKDVAVGIASDQSARVYRDSGSGTLVAGTVMAAVGGTPTSVIVIAGGGSSLLPASGSVGVGLSGSKLKIYASGTLQQEITMAGTVQTVRGGDTGGRSGTDIVTGGRKSASFSMLPAAETGFVQVLKRQGNGLYAIVQTMGLTAEPVGMDVADLDGDGLDDIVTANANPVLAAAGSALPVLSIFRNTSGSFSGGVPYQPQGASAGLSVSLVDADNDGDRDIVSVHRRIAVDSEAALLRVDTLGSGTPISIGQTTVLDADNPILASRGNLDGIGGEDLYLVDTGGGSALTGSASVKPYLAVGGARQGDLDGDGSVNTADVALLLLDFGPCPGCASDLDLDGEVNTGDLALILLMFD